MINLIKEVRQKLGIFNFDKSFQPAIFFEGDEEIAGLIEKYQSFMCRMTKASSWKLVTPKEVPGNCFKGFYQGINFNISLKGYTGFEEEIKKVDNLISKQKLLLENL